MLHWPTLPFRFQYPELLLLALPLGFAFWHLGRTRGVTGWIRVVLLVLLLLVLTGPEWDLGGQGLDVVVVVDRSRSMSADADERIIELISILNKARGQGDRVGIVTFGQDAAVESMLSRNAVLGGGYTQQILPDGSDLNAGLTTALNLVDPNRPARILVLSDGEANGPPTSAAVRRARELQVPIDYREFERLRIGDAAVEAVLLPEKVGPLEPFQFSAVIFADKEVDGSVIVTSGGRQVASIKRHFSRGSNQVLLRDVIEAAGLHAYTVKLEVDQDPIPENNQGSGVVSVEAGQHVLVLNQDGADDNLVRALRGGRISVDVSRAGNHPLTQDSLERYRAVILENVPARDFGRVKMERLSQFVEDLGGGLLLTGGERSFGTGGYFKSPLDNILPVSMEIRQEHRKLQMALAIVLDRSGSMAVPVAGGRTKMDLADIGTAECVRMLSAGDSVAVIAVDSAPHIIQPLTPVDNAEAIAQKALTIQSTGGGIFVYTGLVAAGEQLIDAPQLTKHIILFSDANDSEEPGDYQTLLEKFEKAGITTSVIGLGTDVDKDAELLKDIAKRGKGNIMFTNDAQELPRLFTEDTMAVSRSSFVRNDPETQPDGISGQILPESRLMGELNPGTFPSVNGYNLSYLKPEATLGVVTTDEFTAPLSAFWYRGLGRVAALTMEVDGKFSGQLGNWKNYNDFLITHARWLLGGDEPDEAFLKVEHDGQDALVTLELDPDRPGKHAIESPVLTVVPPGDERATPIQIPFEWQGATTLQARFKLSRTGTYRPLVKLGPTSFLRGATVTLPYSPEFAPRTAEQDGFLLLKTLAQMTGGKQRVNLPELLIDHPRASTKWPLAPTLLIAGICLLLLEIAGRRLSLWMRFVDPVATVPVQSELFAAPVPSSKKGASINSIKRSLAATKAVPNSPVASSPEKPSAPRPMDPFEEAKLRAKRRQS